MKKIDVNIFFCLVLFLFIPACNQNKKADKIMQTQQQVTAKEILGNPKHLAMSYGGYRQKNREDGQPTITELKEDMKLLSAIGVKIIRTYNVQPNLPHAKNILKAISELKKEDASFEMFVMLGAWIDCLNAWTELPPNHDMESPNNADEIERAVVLANQYPNIVKIIAVGNEAMVKWATSYYVQPNVILKWVNHLQNLKIKGKLSKDLWITSSDNFASWGGGKSQYHVDDLNKLIKAVDYISIHTYPYHDTHYNPEFWKVHQKEINMPKHEQVELAMERAVDYAKNQYYSVVNYMNTLGIKKPVHIGETGWATSSNSLYGKNGSRASDEYKQAMYYDLIRKWTNDSKISCFYFEAFDEQWKDATHPQGSENHFGLFTIDGKAKYSLWDLVDNGVFKNNISRNRSLVEKTFNGDSNKLMEIVLTPPVKANK